MDKVIAPYSEKDIVYLICFSNAMTKHSRQDNLSKKTFNLGSLFRELLFMTVMVRSIQKVGSHSTGVVAENFHLIHNHEGKRG